MENGKSIPRRGRRKRKRKSEREREGEERTSAPWITMRPSRLLHRHNYDSIPIADSYSGLIFKSLYQATIVLFSLSLSLSRWIAHVNRARVARFESEKRKTFYLFIYLFFCYWNSISFRLFILLIFNSSS